jgi:steroid Delta-isomerase
VSAVSSPGEFADAHVAAFNAAVRSGDFAGFLTGFEADAVIRFENVPGAGVLEFAGRSAYTAAYTAQPPDDQIDIAGPPGEQDGLLVIPFRWRRDGATGTMRLTRNGDRIAGMTVTFS